MDGWMDGWICVYTRKDGTTPAPPLNLTLPQTPYPTTLHPSIDQVTPEGRYVKPPRKEMAYGALIGTRALLVKTAVDFQKKALMIGLRYAALRTQVNSGCADAGLLCLMHVLFQASIIDTCLRDAVGLVVVYAALRTQMNE